ncbi:DnaB-like helicase C-terminal domain-containing protein [Anaerolinea sp.]|uniref:DnaB-like helicase C-terminal domain-containing protein n=1 Tax=Anaerolinea sp. TaxID=1872519 RepID=UPI002ACE01F2|nr:DnaB-like helicase C-terminal domain-containing protein [Anaerolinea sp.]
MGAIQDTERILLCAIQINEQNRKIAENAGLMLSHFLLQEIAYRILEERIPVPFKEDVQIAASKLDAESIQKYVSAVIDAYREREVARLLREAGKAAQSGRAISPILEKIEQIETLNPGIKILSAQEALAETYFSLSISRETTNFIELGIPTLKGSVFLEPGNMALLVSRPGNGKSAMALWIADKVARTSKSVVYVSLEMSEFELGLRLASRYLKRDYATLRLSSSEEDLREMSDAVAKVPENLYFVCDAMTSDEIEASVRAQSPDLVIIDYVGLVEYPGIHEDTPRLSAVSRWCKRIAKRYKTAVLAVHQLNRDAEQRGGGPMKMSFIRGSGQLEQDSSVIMFLYPKDEEQTPPPDQQEMILEVLKNRNAPTRKIPVVFNRPYMDFDFPPLPKPRSVFSVAQSANRQGLEG